MSVGHHVIYVCWLAAICVMGKQLLPPHSHMLGELGLGKHTLPAYWHSDIFAQQAPKLFQYVTSSCYPIPASFYAFRF